MLNKIIDIYPVKRDSNLNSILVDDRMRHEFLNNEFCLTIEGSTNKQLQAQVKKIFSFINCNYDYVIYSRYTMQTIYTTKLALFRLNLELV